MAEYNSFYTGEQIDAAVYDGQIMDGVKFEDNPLCFVAHESGTFKFTQAISYSLTGGLTWTTLPANTNTPTIEAGCRIFWGGSLVPQPYAGIGTFSSTGKFSVEGNVMSLFYGNNYSNRTSFPNSEDFGGLMSLFKDCTNLISAKNLCLPVTNLPIGAYASMFQNCTSLVIGPKIPVASTFAGYAFAGMYQGCTSLKQVTCLSAIGGTTSSGWLQGVSAHGTVIMIKENTTGMSFNSTSGIPSGWGVLWYSL
jgi:hypothetical protein